MLAIPVRHGTKPIAVLSDNSLDHLVLLLAELMEKLAEPGRAWPGQMRLVREWSGTVNIVQVGEDGVIRWNGKAWS